MKITIVAEPKEIAALVVEIQERPKEKFIPCDSNGPADDSAPMTYAQFTNSLESISTALGKAIH